MKPYPLFCLVYTFFIIGLVLSHFSAYLLVVIKRQKRIIAKLQKYRKRQRKAKKAYREVSGW